jgi:hypothetical protein
MVRLAGLAGLALAIGSAPARGQELIRGYFGGGVSVPVGSLAADAKTGYDFLLGVSWRAPFTHTSLRFDAMFSEFTQRAGAPAYAQMASGNVNGQYQFGLGPIAPYVFGGPGYYFLRGDNAAALAVPLPTTQGLPYQNSHFGVDAGAGVRYRLAYLSVFLEGRDNLVFSSRSERNYVPVTAGVSIPYPWGEPGTTGVPAEP